MMVDVIQCYISVKIDMSEENRTIHCCCFWWGLQSFFNMWNKKIEPKI